ncbi:hypothetical protein [Sphingorhabdus profundilacus]|nr:hypothetical protein [Sphingorhabdus profundilacus]
MDRDGGLAVIGLDQLVILHDSLDSDKAAGTGDISEMTRIFLALAFAASFFGPASCGRHTFEQASLPSDVAKVTTPFMAALRQGDRSTVDRYISGNFADDSALQFDRMSQQISASPVLVPRVFSPETQLLGPNMNEVRVIYAAQVKEEWVSTEIKLFKPKGGTYKVGYWTVKKESKPPALLVHIREMQRFVNWLLIAIASIALFGLGLIIWAVKRRIDIITPDLEPESRPIATTVRD